VQFSSQAFAGVQTTSSHSQPVTSSQEQFSSQAVCGVQTTSSHSQPVTSSQLQFSSQAFAGVQVIGVQLQILVPLVCGTQVQFCSHAFGVHSLSHDTGGHTSTRWPFL